MKQYSPPRLTTNAGGTRIHYVDMGAVDLGKQVSILPGIVCFRIMPHLGLTEPRAAADLDASRSAHSVMSRPCAANAQMTKTSSAMITSDQTG